MPMKYRFFVWKEFQSESSVTPYIHQKEFFDIQNHINYSTPIHLNGLDTYQYFLNSDHKYLHRRVQVSKDKDSIKVYLTI